MNVEVQIEEGMYQPQVKTEMREYEDGEIYQDSDVYHEVSGFGARLGFFFLFIYIYVFFKYINMLMLT